MSFALTYPTFTRRKYPLSLHSEQPAIDAAVTVVRKTGTYFAIPAFSVDTVWRGASQIVAKFNFSLDENINLIRDITPQEGFCACISWKPTSTTIVRYKLWENVGEILYVDLYNGEKIGSDFAIEIWSVQPEAGEAGGTLVTEDGIVLVTEDDMELVTEQDSGTLIGTQMTITFNGIALLYTTILIIPTDFCDLSDTQIGGTPGLCRDITFEDTDEVIPADGDYYILDGICGETTLVHGVRFIGTGIVLQSDDGTWHELFLVRVNDGENEYTIHSVDQDPASPSLTPFIRLALTPTRAHKVNILDNGTGFYFANVVQDIETEKDYNVLYMQTVEDSLYYGLRLQLGENGKVFLSPAQENTVI